MIHEPHAHRGNLAGKLFKLYAVELIDADLEQHGRIQHQGIAVLFHLQDVIFKLSQLPVGDDEEVAAAAGRIKKLKRGYFVMEGIKQGRGCLDLFKFCPEPVHEEGIDDLKDIFL